jgi:O-antigen/teichoic acid export membrane protein
VIIFFGKFLIYLIYGSEFLPAYPALMILLVGYAFSNLVFWNRPLLLALGLPGYPFWATLLSGIAKLALAIIVIPAMGTPGAAGLLSGYFILSGGLMALRGLRQLRSYRLQEPSITAGTIQTPPKATAGSR